MDTPTVIDAKYCHIGIKNMLTHMHKEALALHDSFLNFCPLSTSCSVTLGLWVSRFVSVYVKQKRERNTVCSQHFSHNLSTVFV